MPVFFSKQLDRQSDVLASKRLRIAAASCLRVAPIRLILEEGFCHEASLGATVLVSNLLQFKDFLANLVADRQDELTAEPEVSTEALCEILG